MKLIIDIQDFVYNNVKEFDTTHNYELNIVESIKNGTPLEEELEKIKEEISMTNGCGDFIATYDIQKLIDNHISELKGENNPDCRNCDKWKTCENGEKGHANGTSIGYSIGECRDYVELKGE